MTIETLLEVFPWAKSLPDDGRQEMLDEINEGVSSSILDILAWHSTAIIYDDPELLAILTEPFDSDDFIEVERP